MEAAGIIWRDRTYFKIYWLIHLQHDNQPPASYSERNQLKECIRKGMRTVDEENFEEALANVWRLATTNTASLSILFFFFIIRPLTQSITVDHVQCAQYLRRPKLREPLCTGEKCLYYTYKDENSNEDGLVKCILDRCPSHQGLCFQ